jgi:small subunit ribosomal protein S6
VTAQDRNPLARTSGRAKGNTLYGRETGIPEFDTDLALRAWPRFAGTMFVAARLPRLPASHLPVRSRRDQDRRGRLRPKGDSGNVNEYEILLLLDPELDEGRQDEVVTRTRELVERSGGTWDLHDVWGKRKLAYEIGHKGEGTYHLLQFTSDAETLDEVSRVLRIDDAVMRHMPTRRIQGSPARPVAVSAPTREDAETEAVVEDEEE